MLVTILFVTVSYADSGCIQVLLYVIVKGVPLCGSYTNKTSHIQNRLLYFTSTSALFK